MTEQRRLAAIVSADVAGYSRLMGQDESGTLAALKALRRQLIDPKIRVHRGRIVKTMGDGLLLEFASAVDAVLCVIEIQASIESRNSDVQPDRRIEFRVGVNIGDIISDGDDIFGDGVNVAARLQEIASPGGICVSDFVQQQVSGKVEVEFGDLGEHQVKNIARPVRAYQLRGWPASSVSPTIPSDAAAGATSESGARPALAILPFDNLGGNAELEGFCDGLVEDLTTALSRFRWVHVVSRKSSFGYKGSSSDVRVVARELGVTYVLEGSVRKAGSRIRVNAQLINANSGAHAWARRYDLEYRDPFGLQDQVVRSVLGSLDYVLWTGMVKGEGGAGTPDPLVSPLRAAAWHVIRGTKADNRLGISHARRALEVNPRSVAAYQYVALGLTHDVMSGWSESPSDDLATATEAGRKAVMLSPAASLSHALSSAAFGLSRDQRSALAAVQRALDTNENSANAWGPAAIALSHVGEAREANELMTRILDVAPAHYCRPIFAGRMAMNFLRLGLHDSGLTYAEEATKLGPEMPSSYAAYAALLGAIGHLEEARAALATAFMLRPDLDLRAVKAMFPYSDPKDEKRLADAIRAAGIEDFTAQTD